MSRAAVQSTSTLLDFIELTRDRTFEPQHDRPPYDAPHQDRQQNVSVFGQHTFQQAVTIEKYLLHHAFELLDR